MYFRKILPRIGDEADSLSEISTCEADKDSNVNENGPKDLINADAPSAPMHGWSVTMNRYVELEYTFRSLTSTYSFSIMILFALSFHFAMNYVHYYLFIMFIKTS